MNIDAWITAEWVDSKGKKHRKTRKANSLVVQFFQCLWSRMNNTDVWILDVDNTARTVLASQTTEMQVTGGSGSVTGLVVGTGATTVYANEYKLVTVIANGSGSGQLNYGATTFTNPATDGSSRTFTISRTFTNASGATVSIHEVGLYGYWYSSGSPYWRNHLVDRTLFDLDITNGNSGTLMYTIKVTV